jgi:hypothetical protein
MRKKTPHLKLAIDLGASAGKAFGSIDDDPHCIAVLTTPHCIKVENIMLPLDPDFDENSAWVRLDDDLYVVGRLAVTKYRDDLKVRPAKIVNALPKICATIGIFAQKFNLPAKFKVSIAYVLPPAEWGQRSILQAKLKAIEKIQTPRGAIEPTLLGISAVPEGMGILSSRGLNLKSSGVAIAVMVGFRNASILVSSYGVVDRAQTSGFGFHSLLEDVVSKTGYNIEETIEPVFNYRQALLVLAKATKNLAAHQYALDRSGHNTPSRQTHQDSIEQEQQQIATNNSVRQKCFNHLLRCTDKKDRDIEITMMIKAIEAATATYVRRLSDWLDEMLPLQSDKICLCGGTANYLGSDLDALLISKLRSGAEQDLYRHSPLTLPPHLNRSIDVDRFADIYALWHQMTNPAVVTK